MSCLFKGNLFGKENRTSYKTDTNNGYNEDNNNNRHGRQKVDVSDVQNRSHVTNNVHNHEIKSIRVIPFSQVQKVNNTHNQNENKDKKQYSLVECLYYGNIHDKNNRHNIFHKNQKNVLWPNLNIEDSNVGRNNEGNQKEKRDNLVRESHLLRLRFWNQVDVWPKSLDIVTKVHNKNYKTVLV